MGLLTVPAVLLVELLQGVIQGHALGGVPCGHLGDDHGGSDGVLIPDEVAQHVTIGLLEGHDDIALVGLGQSVHLLGHELEAGEGIVAGDAVALGHLAGHLSGDDGLQQHGLFGHGTGTLLGADHIVGQQHAGLVAGDGDEITLAAADHDAHAVAVGVGAHDEVSAHLVGQVDGQIEALGVLRVGGLDGGEAAVKHHLLGHAVDVLHAQRLQSLGHQLVAAAVEGGVDHMEGVGDLGHGGLVGDHGGDMAHEAAVGVLTDDLDETLCLGLFKVHGLDAGEDVDLLQALGNGGGVLGGQLCAVGPVDLIAVVLLGVVAGGDVDTGLAAVLTDGEAQLGGGAQALEQADMDAVGGAHLGGLLGEQGGVDAAVHADGHALLLGLLALSTDDVGEALGGPADDIDIHLVQAHLHGAAQTGGTELQRTVETALDLLLITGDALELFQLLCGENAAVEPLFVFLFVRHMGVLLSVVTYSSSSTGWADRIAWASS